MTFLVTDTALKSEVASEHTLTSETHVTPMKITRDVLWQWQEDLRFSLSMKKGNHVQDNPARSSNELSCSTYLSFISTVSALPSLPSTTIAFFPPQKHQSLSQPRGNRRFDQLHCQCRGALLCFMNPKLCF